MDTKQLERSLDGLCACRGSLACTIKDRQTSPYLVPVLPSSNARLKKFACFIAHPKILKDAEM